MTVSDKIAELQTALAEAPPAVAEALRAEIKRLSRLALADAGRIFHDVHNGDLKAGDTVYAFEHRPWRDQQQEVFQVRTILAVSPKGDRYAVRLNGGRPDYEDASTVWNDDRSKVIGKTLGGGGWRRTKQEAWDVATRRSLELAEERLAAAHKRVAEAEQDVTTTAAYIDTFATDLAALPEITR